MEFPGPLNGASKGPTTVAAIARLASGTASAPAWTVLLLKIELVIWSSFVEDWQKTAPPKSSPPPPPPPPTPPTPPDPALGQILVEVAAGDCHEPIGVALDRAGITFTAKATVHGHAAAIAAIATLAGVPLKVVLETASEPVSEYMAPAWP